MASRADNIASIAEPCEFRQGDRAQEPHLVHGRGARRVPLPQLRAAAGRQPADPRAALRPDAGRHPRPVQHLFGRQPRADEPHRARHHAVHHRVDRGAACRFASSGACRAQEGRRDRPPEAQPVHALRHGVPVRCAGLVPCLRARGVRRVERDAGGRDPRPHVPRDRGYQPGRRFDVPSLAGRTDHQSRHRQRRVADHHGGHRGAVPDLRGAAVRRCALGLDQRFRARRVRSSRWSDWCCSSPSWSVPSGAC